MNLSQYIDSINQRYKLGNATEHTFRGDLQQLIETIVPEIRATNEPKRQSCGAPDYILTKKDIPVGFIEAKDIGDQDLDGNKKTGNKEQFDRYKASLNNLIFTDYLNFHLCRDGQIVMKIQIGQVTEKGIKPINENFAIFEAFIKDFCTHIGQTIKSSKKLAEMMAGKARLLSDVIEKALTSDETSHEDSTLKSQMEAFKQILIHDITPKGFADVYAQTIAYGMFAARLHDPTLPTFSRHEAAELIPKSNPFLRKLFGYIAGPDLDDRIKWIVDNLVDIFLHTNVEEILKDYGKSTKMEDPIIHFYETFLSEYDTKLRKARGVWYTPQPVVNFIVRAVDDILITEFGLPRGLADNSKTKIKVDNQNGKKVEMEVHRVQILDPATGTGTFLAEVIKQVHSKFQNTQGIWSLYVENNLLPRLNGFELLMASYAMAHLKLDLLLTETGFRPTTNQRFRVYLTNSLEESHPDTGTLFANWLSQEANEANQIKRDTPVMCIIGNPPYSGISTNKGRWISDLIEQYKYVDGVHFNERKHWLNDDYVKFIRFGQHFVERNGSGILAYINPHGFLDNPTFRGMRWNLLSTFDKIYIIDLHGNSKKKETAKDGGADINVFDIQQGVSINLFIKNGVKSKNKMAQVYHFDVFGKRENKYDFLLENRLKNVNFNLIETKPPYYFFCPKKNEGEEQYNEGFQIDQLFKSFTSGMVTANDTLTIYKTEKELINNTNKILTSQNPYIEYNIKDTRRTTKEGRIEDLKQAKKAGVMKINYRPFDINFMYQFSKNEHWINSPRIEIMQHFIKDNNVGMVVAKQCADSWKHVFCTKSPSDFNLTGTAGRYGAGYVFPLYLYNSKLQTTSGNIKYERVTNLTNQVVSKFETTLNLKFSDEENSPQRKLASINIFDYVYAVLHSNQFRTKFNEFLKVDFPKIPYPKDIELFWQLVELGSQLRQIHLMEISNIDNYIIKYPVDGDNEVKKVRFETYLYEVAPTDENGNFVYPDYLGNVHINETQYFANVPLSAWEFYIGGYQPAQKWLKDRKGRKLEFEDILHYQKIIVALVETGRLMQEIDKINLI